MPCGQNIPGQAENDMIEELSVKNFALIESLSISLDSGFTVLTGETGAGKSIIVGSLGFLLGGKPDVDLIRSGSTEASVSAVLTIDKNNLEAFEWLNQRDIELDDSRIIVRRTIKSNGRSSIYVQDAPVSRNDLSEFMSLLFDLHGQHNHESLLRKETHRVYLDRFLGLDEELQSYHKVFLELSDKRKALEAINTNERDREARLEILSYGIEEITKANIKAGEIKELEAETQRLGDFEKLSIHVNNAAESLYDADKSSGESLLSSARQSRTALEHAAAIDASLSPILKRLEDLYYEAEDLSAEFRDYRDKLSYDPQRLEEAEERLNLLYRLKKKYRPQHKSAASNTTEEDEKDILAYKAEAEAEIEALTGTEQNQEKIKEDIARLEKDLILKAKNLSGKRQEGALRLNKGITEILSSLGMPKAEFAAQVLQKSAKEGREGLIFGPWGADDIEFLISANTGEPLKDLSRIASGGELSRIMLAIKTILYGASGSPDLKPSQGDVETLVFDEVDTGIGGEVALSVGEYLARIGKEKQIFCVTHLASIAVRADNHLRVEKKVISNRTITEVSALETEDRRQEIARMLAGDSGTAALAHADDLLIRYAGQRA